jgi:hypothetical protein
MATNDRVSMTERGVVVAERTPKLRVRHRMIVFVSSGLMDGVLVEPTKPYKEFKMFKLSHEFRPAFQTAV